MDKNADLFLEYSTSRVADWHAAEEELLQQVKDVSKRISERVRTVLGGELGDKPLTDSTDEWTPLPDDTSSCR
jgi:hypothetical protein